MDQQPADAPPPNEPPAPEPPPDAAASAPSPAPDADDSAVPPPAAPTQPPASPPPAAPPVAPAPAPVPVPAAPSTWQAAPVEAAPGPMPGVGFAPHVGRLIAYIIDAFIIGIVVTVVAVILTPILIAGADSDNTGALAATVFLYTFVVLLVSVSYFPFFWARGGQTPGMGMFKLRVVRDFDGGRIGGATAVIRLIGLWISFIVFYLGIIWILVDKRRRGWQDLMAGTVVIHQP